VDVGGLGTERSTGSGTGGVSCDSFHLLRSISSFRIFQGFTVGKGAGRYTGVGAGGVGDAGCVSFSVIDEAGVKCPCDEPSPCAMSLDETESLS